MRGWGAARRAPWCWRCSGPETVHRVALEPCSSDGERILAVATIRPAPLRAGSRPTAADRSERVQRLPGAEDLDAFVAHTAEAVPHPERTVRPCASLGEAWRARG